MVVVDANVLLHAVNAQAPQHELSRRWLAGALAGSETVGFSWSVLLAFVRVATHRGALPRPLDSDQATAAVEAWLGAGPAIAIEPTRRHLPLLRSLLASTGTAGNLAGDAHLAALALEHGATVVSFDRDFGRFEGLSWRLPG